MFNLMAKAKFANRKAIIELKNIASIAKNILRPILYYLGLEKKEGIKNHAQTGTENLRY